MGLNAPNIRILSSLQCCRNSFLTRLRNEHEGFMKVLNSIGSSSGSGSINLVTWLFRIIAWWTYMSFLLYENFAGQIFVAATRSSSPVNQAQQNTTGAAHMRMGLKNKVARTWGTAWDTHQSRSIIQPISDWTQPCTELCDPLPNSASFNFSQTHPAWSDTDVGPCWVSICTLSRAHPDTQREDT